MTKQKTIQEWKNKLKFKILTIILIFMQKSEVKTNIGKGK